MEISKIPSVKNIAFTTVLDVRVSDINYGNHLGHDSLITLLQEARVRFLKAYGYTELDIDGLIALITHLSVNYLKQAFYATKLIVNLEIIDVKQTNFKLLYQVINQETGKDIAKALTTITMFNREKNKVEKIPQEFLKKIKK
jgi:acyl-CoA thioester hydrolase